jgi:polysaccharide export outer membrane protein
MKHILLFLAFALLAAQQLAAQTTIRSGRAIEIQLKGVPSEEMALVSGTYTVSDSGMVSMPLLSAPVRAAGLSATALARSIEAAYRAEKIYTTPTVNVIHSTDQTLNELTVTVGGKVNAPGPVKYVQGLTLYNAVQAARGPTEFGAMNRVALLRNGQRREYDLNNTKHMNILVEPNDTITVPPKNIFNK